MKAAMAFQKQQSHILMAHRGPSPSPSPISPKQQGVDFSPPLIAMVVVVAAAFIVVTYCRVICRRVIHPMLQLFRRRPRSTGDVLDRDQSPSSVSSIDVDDDPSNLEVISNSYGLDEAAIKTLPLSVYRPKKSASPPTTTKECAVCLAEFRGESEEEEGECYLRTLPLCSHAFHLHCIDVWLKSHANCPLCRAAIFVGRPTDAAPPLIQPPSEITEQLDQASPRHNNNFLVKRSYSFGFERGERLVQTSASPWHHRLWSKRMASSSSPLFMGKAGAPRRVMSFRSYLKASPLLIRRARVVSSCRRSKSMAGSPMRCRDLEALVSPERLNRVNLGWDALTGQ